MKSRALEISVGLSLPPDTVTSTLVVYGGKGMGKTNLGSVLMEELAEARLRFAVIDPMGVWWGLRHDKDGKGKGIEVLILGGIHGDIPIEPTAGAVVADLVADESVNVVIDISRRPDGTMWSIGERIRFVRDYSKRVYQRQGERRRPLMQVIDEAARFIPQVVRKDESDVAGCMGAVAVLVEEGRNVGIGVTLITQRSARLNKDVAELADCMIAFRTVGPNSRRAVLDWLGEHVEKERLKDLDAKVRSLPVGVGLVVSPGWLGVEAVVKFRSRQTFDSSKTPKAGEAEARVSGEGAKPDLNQYRARMAETIEKAKADDPKELKKRVAELERQLQAKPAAAAPAKAEVKVVDRPVLKDGQLARIEKLSMQGGQLAARLIEIVRELNAGGDVIADALRQVATGNKNAITTPLVSRPAPARPTPAPAPRFQKASPDSGTEQLPAGERKVLIAIAQHPDGVTREQLTILTGYKRSSRDTYLQRLGARGFVDIAERIRATDAGVAVLGTDYEPLPTGTALYLYWRDRLPTGEAHILRLVYDKGTQTREAISEETGYKRSSRDTYIQRLAARRLIVIDRDGITIAPELF